MNGHIATSQTTRSDASVPETRQADDPIVAELQDRLRLLRDQLNDEIARREQLEKRLSRSRAAVRSLSTLSPPDAFGYRPGSANPPTRGTP